MQQATWESNALDTVQAEQELSDDIYFFKEDDGKWKLSIFKPLRWGIAGTAQIAEDVVSHLPFLKMAHPMLALVRERGSSQAINHSIEAHLPSTRPMA